MTPFSREDRESILKRVCRLVEKKHFNPKLNGADWPAAVERRREAILNASDPDAFEHEMQELLSELKTSHTGFFHRSARKIPARFAITATFQSCPTDAGDRWVFLDVHPGGPADSAGLQPGDVLLEIDRKEISPPTAPTFRMGDEVALTVHKRDGSRRIVKLTIPNPKSKKRPMCIPKAVLVSKLAENIGYLRVSMFPGAIGIDFAKQIDRAMQELRECDRLIIDLRGNSGGGIGGLRLMSYLTPDKLPVGYSLTRHRAERGYDKEKLPRFTRIPSKKPTLLWLALRYGFIDKSIVVVTEGLGPQKFHGRVIILVNQHSASAAEMLAAFAQENRLATIVGTKTAGRLLSGRTFSVGRGYVLGLPVAGYVTWRGKLLENDAVHPDEEVISPCNLLKEAHDVQMKRALDIARLGNRL